MRLAVLALYGLALSACGTEPPGTSDPDASHEPVPRIELGTGMASFVPIAASGDTLELVMGPQGGYHVDVAIRIWDLDPDGISILYEVARVSNAAVLSTTPFVFDAGRFVREGDHLVHTGDFTVLEISGPSDVDGAELELRVVATEAGGATALDTRRVTIVDER